MKKEGKKELMGGGTPNLTPENLLLFLTAKRIPCSRVPPSPSTYPQAPSTRLWLSSWGGGGGMEEDQIWFQAAWPKWGL